MSDGIPVLLPKESVSDDSYLLVEIVRASGESVEMGDVIARCETSKATLDITAPCSGYIHHLYLQGQEIPVGGILGVVTGSAVKPEFPSGVAEKAAPTVAADPGKAAPPHAADPIAGARVRPTPLARKIMVEHGLTDRDFPGRTRVMRSDVFEKLEASQEPHAPTRFSRAALRFLAEAAIPESSFPGAGLVDLAKARKLAERTSGPIGGESRDSSEPRPEASSLLSEGGSGAAEEAVVRVSLAKSKRAEIKSLQAGQSGVLASAISVLVSGAGAFNREDGSPHAMLLSAVVYEASRLLRLYPELNGYYQDGHSVQYRDVDVGIAFEIDSGLKVPRIRRPDTLSLAEIRSAIDGFILKYLEKSLSLEELTGATFTVTDLSADRVFNFLPLINQGQSAILGIGGYQAFADQDGMYALTLAFDHRVSTGRRVSRFLGDLKRRLESFADPLGASAAMPPVRRCRICRRAGDELNKKQFMLVADFDGRRDFLCTMCAKGW